MQCERLLKLTKSWYLSVQDASMAPARMLAFIRRHAENCEVCLNDADLEEEIVKIAGIILPETKLPEPVPQEQEAEEEELDAGDDDEEEETDDDVDLDDDFDEIDDDEIEEEIDDEDL